VNSANIALNFGGAQSNAIDVSKSGAKNQAIFAGIDNNLSKSVQSNGINAWGNFAAQVQQIQAGANGNVAAH
ncbi:hypothetical protein HDU96_000802, partial [Phlyctochytrium bullatum]